MLECFSFILILFQNQQIKQEVNVTHDLPLLGMSLMGNDIGLGRRRFDLPLRQEVQLSNQNR